MDKITLSFENFTFSPFTNVYSLKESSAQQTSIVPSYSIKKSAH